MKMPLTKNEAANLAVAAFRPHMLSDAAVITSNDTDLQRTAAKCPPTRIKRQRFFQNLSIGFGLASTILVTIGLVSYRSITRSIQAFNQVEQTQAVLQEVNEVFAHIKDAETGQRGYIITGKQSYLEPYRVATTKIAAEFQQLRQLTTDPAQQQRLALLESLTNKKLAELDATITLRQTNGFAAASSLIQMDHGKQVMDNIRELVEEIKSQENQRLTQRSYAATANANYTISTFSSGIFLTFCIFAGVYYFIYREICERRRIQVALQQQHDFIGAVLDTSAALVAVIDTQGRIIRFNHACEQTTHYSFAEVRYKYFWDLFIVPEEVESVKAVIQELEAGQFPNEHENYWRTKNGDRRLIAWSNTALLNDQGTVEYIIGTGIDITERQHAEQSLRENEARLRLAFAAAHMGTWDWNVVDNKLVYSEQLGPVFGLPPGGNHPTYEAFLNCVHPDDREYVAENVGLALDVGAEYDIEFRVIWLDNSLHWVGSKGQVYRDPNAQPTRMIGVALDITERKQTEEALQQANNQLTTWVNQLEERNSEITLLGKMSDVLQACLTLEEAYTALPNLVQPLFPNVSGAIYLISASRNIVEAVATWGSQPFNSQTLFAPHDCWALRRGRVHSVEDTHNGLLCQHLDHNLLPNEYLCVPMMAQGEALGMLYLSSSELECLTAIKKQLAVTVAEHIAWALANLKLRETLQNNSIRDPLTNLFNRRYMEESLEREIYRCQRKQQSLGVVMIDVDHFKRFNDTFGHEAGDAVLQELGLFLQKYIRKSDIACRYGGEELTLILPETSLEVIRQRAEKIREGVKHLHLQHRRQSLGTITLSLGVACFPEHGLTKTALLQAADEALYRAKAAGRDRVFTA